MIRIQNFTMLLRKKLKTCGNPQNKNSSTYCTLHFLPAFQWLYLAWQKSTPKSKHMANEYNAVVLNWPFNVILYSRQIHSNVHNILMVCAMFMEMCNKYDLKRGIWGTGFSTMTMYLLTLLHLCMNFWLKIKCNSTTPSPPPDLMSCDFFLFQNVTMALKRKRFNYIIMIQATLCNTLAKFKNTFHMMCQLVAWSLDSLNKILRRLQGDNPD